MTEEIDKFRDHLSDPWNIESNKMEMEILKGRMESEQDEKRTSIERNLEVIHGILQKRDRDEGVTTRREDLEAIYNILKIVSTKLSNLEDSTYHKYA
tara:strand:+ start:850 stop:1140 length:291 start_codon:yes stop_codon:yes gene_type:complete